MVLSYGISHMFIEVDCGVEIVVFQGCIVSRILSMQQNKADVLCAGLLIQGKQDIRCWLFMLSCAEHFDTHHFKQQ